MKYEPGTVRKFAETLAAASGNLPVSLVEKDIWIAYLLRELYGLNAAKSLAFKGGTCLVKVYYGYYRFSEDIDLTWTGEKIRERDFRQRVIQPVIDALSLQWYQDKKVKGIAGTQSGNVMNYFLLAPEYGEKDIKLKITVAFKEKLEFGLSQMPVKPVLPKSQRSEFVALFGAVAEDYFAPSSVLAYSREEIACEKIRAMLTRKPQITRSRDIVDLYVICNDLGGLARAAPANAVKAKLAAALKIPAYQNEFVRTTRNLSEHLKNLAEQARLDPVFLSLPKPSELAVFAEELSNYIKAEKILT